jgi:hypothetical protein
MFLDGESVPIKGDFGAIDEKARKAGMATSMVILDFVKLMVINEESVIVTGLTEVLAEGCREPPPTNRPSGGRTTKNETVKTDNAISAKIGGKVQRDVALVGEEFAVGAGAKVVRIGFHRNEGAELLFVMWGGARYTRIDEGWCGI